MKNLIIILISLSCFLGFSQDQDQRIQDIKNKLTSLSVDSPGLTENVKTDISISNITLGNFLLAVADVHKVNINVSQELNDINISPKLNNVNVADLLSYLCKEYNLTIDFTGNILSIKKYDVSKEANKVIPIQYEPSSNSVSLDVKGDKLYEVFKQIMNKTGKNLAFAPGLESKVLTAYLQNVPFDIAMDKLAFANNLYLEKTDGNFYSFQSQTTNANNNSSNGQPARSSMRNRGSNFQFEVLDKDTKLLKVNFKNASVADVIQDIAQQLDIDIFTATPLNNAGTVSIKAKSILFDDLLVKMFEKQSAASPSNVPNPNTQTTNRQSSGGKNQELFTFKKENDIYFFGTENQLSVRSVEIVQLMHRSVELLSDPSGAMSSGFSSSQNNFRSNQNGFGNNQFDNSYGGNRQQPQTGSTNRNTNTRTGANNNQQASQSLVDILPKALIDNLEISVDYELNSFYVNGSSDAIERFKKFINKIDKPVPVIVIEVMIIEVGKSFSFETGIEWGIGEGPSQTQGSLFPEANVTLGANTINKIIGGNNGFGSLNLGSVVPNFFARIKASESNGDFKIRSTPTIATLNGHRATLSNGQTSYYAVTQRNIYGTDNPQTSEITNYYPIDAQLGINIKPLVSGDGQVTLDILVIQSSFGQRINEDAPPDINSREFSSIIRMKNKDVAILGGLEEQIKRGSGSGVPFLARVPIIKYLFSQRKREGSKSKLTVLIRPIVYN